MLQPLQQWIVPVWCVWEDGHVSWGVDAINQRIVLYMNKDGGIYKENRREIDT